MSNRCTIETATKAMALYFVRLSQYILSPMIVFLLALLVCRVVYLRNAWNYWYITFTQKGLVLTLERALYRIVIVPLVALLPALLSYKVAYLRGDWRYKWDSSKRKEVMNCLEHVLGDQLSIEERVHITRDFFRLRSCYPMDETRLAGKGRALSRLVEFRGLEHIEAALTQGKGAILCGAHFGNYDCCFSLIGACGFPITVVGRWPCAVDPNRSYIERLYFRLTHQKTVERYRHRPAIEPSGQIEAAVQVASILRQNELIGLCLDAPVLAADRLRAVPVDFLNGKALLLPGVTTIAQLTKTPVLMTFMRRKADWRHQVVEISPPVPLDGDAVTAFSRCLAIAETTIRQYPAHFAHWDYNNLTDLGLLSKEAERRKP